MALPVATNSYAVTDPAGGSGLIYIVADPQTVAGNVSVIPWARIVSLAGDNADLATLLNRIGLMTSDAQTRAGFGGVLPSLVNPSGTVDAQRSLASTGGGLGVAAVGGGSYGLSTATAGASISTTAAAPTTALTSTETAAKRRGLIISSTLTQVVTITIWMQTGGASPVSPAGYSTLLTMPAGNVTQQVISLSAPGGIHPLGITAGALSTAPTVTTDGSSQFDMPCTSFLVKASVASAATGNLLIDYLALT